VIENRSLKSPLLFAACFFALGIIIASEWRIGLAFALSACGGCLTLGIASWQRDWRTATAILVALGFLFSGAFAARLFARRFPRNHISHLAEWHVPLNRPVRIDGVLATAPLRMPYGVQFDLSASRLWKGGEARRIEGRVRVRVMNGRRSAQPAVSLHLHYGDSIRAWMQLRRPQNYENPGGFDYRTWIESIQDVFWEGTVEDPSLVQSISAPRPPFLNEAVQSIRGKLLSSIDRLYPPWTVEGKDGAVLKAVLLGDRSSLDSETVENFRQSGLYHLLVVAGLHVGLLAMLAEGLLRLFRLRNAWRSALLILFLGFYASLVEQRAPTLRASLMIAAYLVARLLDREQPILNAVGLAALILLFVRPAWLFDAGFQLSFAAALLIAGLAIPVLEMVTEPYRLALRRVEETALDPSLPPRAAQFRLDIRSAAGWLSRRWPLPGRWPEITMGAITTPLRAGVWVLDLIIFSFILQVGLLLPMAEIFHRITLAGIGLNVFAIPLMTVLLALAVPVVVLNVFAPALAVLPGKLLAFIMKGLFSLTELPHLPHWLSYRVPNPPVWVAWGFALSVVAAAFLLSYSRLAFRISIGAAAICAVLISLHPFPPRIPDGILQVTQLDCGGGDALFMVLPDRTTLLAGACGGSHEYGGGDPLRAERWDPGENIVSPYLWSRGISSIDVFILADSRGDRLDGVASVFRNFRVKEFWYSSLGSQVDSAEVLEMLEQRGARVRRLAAGDTFVYHDSSIRILWAPAPDALSSTDSTVLPVVMRISSAQGSLLLASGLAIEDQQRLASFGTPLRSIVLQLPGQNQSSLDAAFAAKVWPAVALVSSEDKALDPSPFAALKRLGTKVFDSSRDGAVTVSMKHEAPTIHRYTPQLRTIQ
jgi:competence protein ComEC